MPNQGSPLVGRRQLALDLRRMRVTSGRTIEEVARHLECSAAKVSRIETGAVKIGVQDLKAILELYQTDNATRETMLGLVRQAKTRGWWYEFSDVVPPRSAHFYGLEDGASTIRQHCTSLVPGLLQTEAYARALIGSIGDDTPDAVVDRRVELRLRRQQLLRRADPPELDVLLDEAVLHREIGGPGVMAEQLRHVQKWAGSGRVAVRIVEFAAPAHPADGSSFTIFGFADETVRPVVFREQLDSNSFVDEPQQVATYQSALAAAKGAASDRERSNQLITERLRELVG